MGNPISKVAEENKEETSDSDKSAPTTPVLQQKFPKNLQDLDPRSPSANIVRTPLTNVLGPLTCNGSEEILNATPRTTKIILDPRSPTNEFVRTPIVVAEGEEDGKTATFRLRNKNLDNVRKSGIHSVTTPNKGDSKITVDSAKSGVPPKLLESSPITAKINKRKSFVGLLETNLDYVETDLDSVISNCRTPKKAENENKFVTPVKDLKEKFLNSEHPKSPTIDVCEAANADPRSPSTDFLRTPIQILKKIGEIDLNGVKEETSDCEITDAESKKNTDNAPVEDDETPKTLPSEDISKPKAVEVVEMIPKKQDTTIVKNVKEFDKKLSNLIYEDSDGTEAAPRARAVKDNNRTPLGIRNSNGAPKKSLSKLKVNDKPTKGLGASRIPVFKDKLIKGKLEPCENTPPCKNNLKNDNKIKKTQWDADTTLVI